MFFLYRAFGEQIEDLRTFDVTSETRDNTSVIILKLRLTLQVILPARANLVILSLSAPVRNITYVVVWPFLLCVEVVCKVNWPIVLSV